jgi:DNA repair protein RadC
MGTAATKGQDADQQLYLPISDTASILLNQRRIASARDVYDELTDVRGQRQEHFVVLDLSVRHNLLERRVVHIGTLTGVEVHPREVFRGAIVNSAAAIIVAHNHPSGDPSPSRQDIEMTKRLREVAEVLGIPLLDHVVIAANGYISLAERNWQ